jgi:uncharacterized protein YlzI (FlbEa/FlbD family)
MTADIKEVMNRIKNLKEFEVTIDIPDEFMFNGTIPFDMVIDRDLSAKVLVVAESQEEAESKVAEFFKELK